MRKHALVIILALLLAVLATPTLADEAEGPVVPWLGEMERNATVVQRRLTLRSLQDGTGGDALNIDLYKDVAPAYGTAGQWHVEPSDTSKAWKYEFYFGEWTSQFGLSWVIHHQKAGTSASYTGCTIVAPGVYRLMVNVYDPDTGERLCQKSYQYSFAEDADHPSLETLAAGIAAENAGSSDYETALNLHDWITCHMYYDYSYKYYGADGALIRGYGVCDSYSKGYCLLLEAAGIPVYRISSNNHSWNAVQLDGQWYQIDPTWDDPGSRKVPSSGNETHEFFCITDDLMLRSNHVYTPSPARVCDSLAMNYFVLEGGWDSWNLTFQQELASLWFKGLKAAGVYAYGETGRHLTILCWVYNHQPENVPLWVDASPVGFFFDFDTNVFSIADTDGRTVDYPFLYMADGENAILSGRLGIGDTLTVPDSLDGRPVTGVENGAFSGDERLVKVEFPEGLTAIGSGAFSGCSSLQLALVPESLASLGSYAFSGCPLLRTLLLPETLAQVGDGALPEGMIVSCGYDTPLAQALGQSDYPFLDPDQPDWQWQWLMDGAEPELGAAACLSDVEQIVFPSFAQALLDLGDCSLKALSLPDSGTWVSVECTLPQSLLCIITVSGNADAIALGVSHQVPVLLTDRQSTLPAAIREIGAQAYADSALHWLIVPPGTTSIGADAFSGSALAAVTFLATNTDLDSSAFRGSFPVVFAPAGSQVRNSLTNLGLPVLDN